MKIASVALLLLLAPPVAEAQSLRGLLGFLGGGLVDNNNEVAQHGRRTEDFMDMAQDVQEAENLDTLEANGDAEDVSIVDNEVTEQEEDLDLEDEEMALEEELVEDEGYTEEDLLIERRQFVSYEPSAWEQQWTEQIDDIMNAKSFCRTLMGNEAQVEKLHDYMDMMCSTGFDNWCFYNDFMGHYMWYNKDNRTDFELYVDYTPDFLKELGGITAEMQMEPIAIDDDYAHIASKFTYHDAFTEEDYVEYLEPLVSHLHFPLAECLAGGIDENSALTDYAGFVVPPKYLDRTDGRVLLYDVGSSDWSRMQYVVQQWAVQQIDFEFIASYAPTGTAEANDEFPKTVPQEYADRTYRHYFTLVDTEADVTHPDDPNAFFLPTKIKNQTVANDYVVVKLDRGVPASLKDGILQYILNDPDIHIDELIVELNPSNMYVMEQYYENSMLPEDELSPQSMGDVYRMLGALRAKGIRAHAWV